jgi:hypothetical protein
MAHSDDINAQKKTAHDIAQAKLDLAIELKNAGQPRMNKAIADLLDARDALNLADLRAALSSPALAEALAVITAATTALNNTAGQMVTAATIIGNAPTFGTRANAVATAYQAAAALIL